MPSQKWLNDLCSFPRWIIQYHSNPSLCPNQYAEEAEQIYEDLQDLQELTPKKDVLFIIGDWNAKVGSQETPGVTGKFGLGATKEALKMGMFCDQISSTMSFMCNLRESSYTKSVTECILTHQERL